MIKATKIIVFSFFITIGILSAFNANVTANNGECATFDFNTNLLHVPGLDWGLDNTYWLDLKLIPKDPITLQISDIDENSTSTTNANGNSAIFDLLTKVLHIPCLDLGVDNTYWLNLQLVSGDTVDTVSLQLKDYGENLPDSYSSPPNGYQTGRWPTYPDDKYITIPKDTTVLSGEPQVTMTDAWTAQITFTTAISAPAATVYYGMFDPDALLALPRFRLFVKEDLVGESTDHSVDLDLSDLLGSLDIGNLEANNGGVIVYRIEVYGDGSRPLELPHGVMYDRRFEFYNGQRVPTVIEGPLVNQITETGAIISWDTDMPVNGTVAVEGVSDFPAASGGVTHFEVPLAGLSPGTTYYYSVEITDGSYTKATRKYFFRTAAENTTQFTFAVMGDHRGGGIGGGQNDFNGVNANALRSISTRAFNKGAEFIIGGGDTAWGYSSNPAEYAQRLSTYKNVVENVWHYIPIYHTMGNHEAVVNVYWVTDDEPGIVYYPVLYFDKEGDESAESIFAGAFVNPTNGPDPDNAAANTPVGKSLPPYKENVYSFDYGNCRFVVMNTNYWYSGLPEKYGGNSYGYIMDDQMAWANGVFSQTQTDASVEHVFLIMHSPPFPNSSHIRDAMWHYGGDPDQNGGWDRTYIVERRDELIAAFLGTGKAAAIVTGDEHTYSRTYITKDRVGEDFEYPVWQVVAGAGGAPYGGLETDLPWSDGVEKFTTQMSFCMITIDGSSILLKTYNLDGILIDTVDLTAG